jgi:hypothetical protein
MKVSDKISGILTQGPGPTQDFKERGFDTVMEIGLWEPIPEVANEPEDLVWIGKDPPDDVENVFPHEMKTKSKLGAFNTCVFEQFDYLTIIAILMGKEVICLSHGVTHLPDEWVEILPTMRRKESLGLTLERYHDLVRPFDPILKWAVGRNRNPMVDFLHCVNELVGEN